MVAKKKSTVPARLGKNQVQALKVLNQQGELTRGDISKKLGGAFVGGSMMGHVDPKLVSPSSLLGRGLVTVATYPDKETEAEGPAHYKITPAGRKALTEAQAAPKPKAKEKPAKKAGGKKGKKGPPKPIRKAAEPAAPAAS